MQSSYLITVIISALFLFSSALSAQEVFGPQVNESSRAEAQAVEQGIREDLKKQAYIVADAFTECASAYYVLSDLLMIDGRELRLSGNSGFQVISEGTKPGIYIAVFTYENKQHKRCGE